MIARKILLPFHLWTGLTIGLVLVVMAVTGAMLIYRVPLERRFDPRFVVPVGTSKLGVAALIAKAHAARPGVEFDSVHYSGKPGTPFIALFADKVYVHVNPYTGDILGSRQRYGESFGWIEGLHRFLRLRPAIGEAVTGYVALTFVLIIVTGLILWWPASRRALRAGVTFNRKLTGRSWNLNVHKTVAAYASLMLLVSAGTGVTLSRDWARKTLYAVTGSKDAPIPKPTGEAAAMPADFDAIARSISQVVPDAQDTYIPNPKKGLVAAYAVAMDASHPSARSYVWMEPSGKILRHMRYSDASVGFQIYYWMLSLHTGLVGGPVVPVLLLLGALSVPVLAYTGAASYFRRRATRASVPSARVTPLTTVRS